jgi:L-asparaginase/Glu-tRNA(Gln) amidotransferase subunit D
LAFVEAVCGAITADVVVCFVTECEHGGVENTYATGLEALGCISCANETASCAYAKL